MLIEIQELDGIMVFSIEGELDAMSSFDVSREFRKYSDQNINRFVFDLENLEYMNSSGLGTLVALLKRARSQDGDVKLANLKPFVLELFELTRFNEVFEVYSSRQGALAGFNE